MLNNAGKSIARDVQTWSDDRLRFLRSNAADIKRRAAALGQWRAAFDCSCYNWSSSPTA
jgi:hypothetical protein